MRTEGRISGGKYVISGPGVNKSIPLEEAKADRKLLEAIERNGWQELG